MRQLPKDKVDKSRFFLSRDRYTHYHVVVITAFPLTGDKELLLDDLELCYCLELLFYGYSEEEGGLRKCGFEEVTGNWESGQKGEG